MKIGDRVRSIGHFKGIEGTVVFVAPGSSDTDHGCIEIEVTNVDNKGMEWIRVGDKDRFVHWNWQKVLEII